MTTLTMTPWQVTVTNGRRVVSRVSEQLGRASATALAERWAKALGRPWRVVSVEPVQEVTP